MTPIMQGPKFFNNYLYYVGGGGGPYYTYSIIYPPPKKKNYSRLGVQELGPSAWVQASSHSSFSAVVRCLGFGNLN